MFAGEKIELFFYGDEQYDLGNIDFSVFIYPDGNLNERMKFSKSDCTVQPDGSYLLSIGPSVTITLPLTSFTVEINDSTNAVIFMQKGAFSMEQSATALDLINESENEGPSQQ